MTFPPLIVQSGQVQRLQSSQILDTNAPAVRVTRSTTQVVNASAYTPIAFNTQQFSFGGAWWSSTVNPDRITVPVAGIYLIGGHLRIGSSFNVQTQSAITLNGSTDIHVQVWPQTNQGQVYDFSNQVLYQLNQGDYLQLRFRVGAGGFTLSAENGITPSLWAARFR